MHQTPRQRLQMLHRRTSAAAAACACTGSCEAIGIGFRPIKSFTAERVSARHRRRHLSFRFVADSATSASNDGFPPIIICKQLPTSAWEVGGHNPEWFLTQPGHLCGKVDTRHPYRPDNHPQSADNCNRWVERTQGAASKARLSQNPEWVLSPRLTERGG